MKNLQLIIILFGFMLLLGCSKDDKEGDWDDTIKLSKENVVFSNQADSILITTQGNFWWINGVTFEDKTKTIYAVDNQQDDFHIENDEYSVIKRSDHMIHIKMSQNTTDSIRKLNIALQSGDYFGRIKVIQHK